MIEAFEKEELRNVLWDIRASQKTIGFVPTMGFLHDGHLSLVKNSVEKCDFTVVSIFVNPAQFGPNEDLDNYPRDYEQDKKLLENAKTDLIFYPEKESLYPDGFSTWVVEDKLSKVLCGKSRPTHFKGVLTIVAKLFNIVQPDFAFFGQKDYQQLLLIKKMVKELDFPIEIISCPIVRESDGLAMSSRNKYLSDKERSDSLVLPRIIFEIEKAFQDGESNTKNLISLKDKIISDSNSKNVKLEYFEILNSDNLEPLDKIEKSALVAIAGKCGSTRLIDNIILK
ncbi:pantoate--beta-alanine ligase [bacterium]|nr:pantoate--beta-alanine ligase [bacterium]